MQWYKMYRKATVRIEGFKKEWKGKDMIHEIHLQTKRWDEMIDITAQVEELVIQDNVIDGLVVV